MKIFLSFRKAAGLPPRSLVVATLAMSALAPAARGQVDMDINRAVWKQKYGVLDAQLNEQAPYAGWLSQDADGDGVSNSAEFAAGTNPFRKLPGDPHFRSPGVTMGEDTLALGFPTVPGKYYQAEASVSLVDAWSSGMLPGVAGDGTPKSLGVPMEAGHFFRVRVSDRATPGDQVSDWAKIVLGFDPASRISSQSSYDHALLAASLQAQNIVTLSTVIASTSLPEPGGMPEAAVVRITRSGAILPGAVTVPIVKSGGAVEGVDYAPLPGAVTFPAGVGSIDLKITPLANPARTTSAALMITAAAPGTGGAAGNYRLGSPAAAGVTLYPSGKADGTGLGAAFFNGASSNYDSPLNFGGITTGYSYTRTASSTTSGTVLVSYTGTPAVPYTAGSQVRLHFTSGRLNVAPFTTPASYTIVAPVTTGSFTVNVTGTALPASGTGNVSLGGFNAPVTRIDPLVDFLYLYGTPNGNTYIGRDNYSVRWEGYLSPAAAGGFTFQLDADDKARVLLDKNDGAGLQQILENGWDGPATGAMKQSAAVTLAIPASPAARYRIVVEFVETTGAAKCRFQWKPPGAAYANIPSGNVFVNNTGTTTGWTGSYFANTTFTAPAARTQTDTAVTNGNNGDWGIGAPDPAIDLNYFTARWTGQVLPQYTGTYYFAAKTDDGVKLWVDDQLIIDRWGSTGETVAPIRLQAGVRYNLRMEMDELTASALSQLSWYSADQAKQIIPTERLFPTITGAPVAGGRPAAPPAITSPAGALALLGSGPPFSMELTSSNGGVITAAGLPAWLTLQDGVLSGTPTAAGVYQFILTTTNAAGSGSMVMTVEVQAAPGFLTRELWTSRVSGPALSAVPWHLAPDQTDAVTAAEDNADHGVNVGERLRGYITAPATGNYYFWLAGSNAAELWISNDAEPVNKVLRASVTGPAGTGSRIWNAQPGQKSPWLSLVAGRRYYIEILHNTGAGGTGGNLAAAWYPDATGTTGDPIANGAGVIPAHVLSPWDNPPTTAVSGNLYVTNLQGAEGLAGITGTGGSFIRASGSQAVLQLNYSGLSSGVTSRRVCNGEGDVLFDIGAQERNYPALRTSDGGYTWTLSGNDLALLESGGAHIRIGTVNHPEGELTGTFGRIEGSQTPPPAPASPPWPDNHASDDGANSRFLTQATFGPSPSDMEAVRSQGYRAWIENQFTLPATRMLPVVLTNLTSDPNTNYPSSAFFNAWWRNSTTAPDQLRQRAAFALSEILVTSGTGPLENNGRALADYYDVLLESAFGSFREILRQVTLSPAMGEYLDMRGNVAGNIVTGLHPNENYAREILQLFSTGLYRRWPDGTLVLDSKGSAVPTYGQDVITGFARVFTGWNWGQPLNNGRLPTASPAVNYLDPMVLMPARHELGSKILLDNVVLPPATVVTQSDTSEDPSSTHAVQTTDPALGQGNVVTTTIRNRYDLNGLKDLEASFDNIINNSSVAPYICRQLIQRLVTSHPKPEYVHRVVLAFDGRRNVDGIATGVKGDMKEVFRAILLDHEARSATAAADPSFGKQREPLLRITGPARTFPPPAYGGATYRQIGLQQILVKTRTPHRLTTDNVMLANVADSAGVSWKAPAPITYSAANATPSYTLAGSTGIATINAPGYLAGDTVAIQFTSQILGNTAPFNTVRDYTVASATATNFTVNIGRTDLPGVTSSGTTVTPYNFTVNHPGIVAGNYTVSGTTVTISSSGFVAGDKVQVKFATGGLAGAGFDGLKTVVSVATGNFTVTLPSSPASTTAGSALMGRFSAGYAITANGSGSAISLQLAGAHNLAPGDKVYINFLLVNGGVPAPDGLYTVDSTPTPHIVKVLSATALGTGTQTGAAAYLFPQAATVWTRSGTATVNLSTWNVSVSQNDLAQTPMNSPTVFNFFYPDFQYPGAIAKAGMTTPEFQLTNDSTIMSLTNAVSGSILSAANPNGFTSYKTGTGAVTMDLSPYMTESQTNAAGIPGLVDRLSTLLTGGPLAAGSRTTIINYVTSTADFPFGTVPTNTQMRDRVRSIIQLILTSPDYAIQR